MDMTLENFIKWINMPIIHVGGSPVTFSGLVSAGLIVLVAFIFSRLLQRVLEQTLRSRLKLSDGVIFSILRFLHYTILILGVVVAVQSIGLNLGSLAVIFGFLSVGIGFGLQNITSNFISGLILLVERPVSVGDFVNVAGQVGKVQNISMRSTIVLTLDNVSIIVPNSKFIEAEVINWSLDDPRVRIHCPVGVAYGSDTAKIREALMEVASSHREVLKNPTPEVRFLEFGNSSLNFDLLVWIDNPLRQDNVRSEINFAIDEAFRKRGIEIPFPQCDLNLRMTPALKEIIDRTPGTKN